MANLDIPEPPKLSRQLLWIAVVLLVLGILAIIFAKVFVAFIIFLLGAIMGIGAQVTKHNYLDSPK